MGKTSLLESITLCSIGKSCRTPRDKELIKWEKDTAKVEVIVQKTEGDEKVSISLSRVENKRVQVNSLPLSKLGELMGVVSTVFFSPQELKVVQGAPSERRAFIDIALCQLSKTYFYLLARYNKILSQRNKLLKSNKLTDDALDIWDTQLASEGAKVIKTRKGFITQLAPFAIEHHAFLSSDKENITIEYEGLGGDTIEQIQIEFLQALKKDKEKDLRLGYTHTGPHKDDISVKNSKMDLRIYGSQGQQRTAALSLKLAQLFLATQKSFETPVLLLDDVLSELDLTRQQKLLDRIKGFQTIITCTHLEPAIFETLKNNSIQFVVQDGEVNLINKN